MRAHVLGFFLLAAICGTSCGDETAPPVDALPEHVIPADLGRVCGPPGNCYEVTSQPGGGCQERCVTVGKWQGICTTRCNTEVDCGPAAPSCMETGAGRFCMAMTGDPNAGCPRPDGNFMPDARPRDAEF